MKQVNSDQTGLLALEFLSLYRRKKSVERSMPFGHLLIVIASLILKCPKIHENHTICFDFECRIKST